MGSARSLVSGLFACAIAGCTRVDLHLPPSDGAKTAVIAVEQPDSMRVWVVDLESDVGPGFELGASDRGDFFAFFFALAPKALVLTPGEVEDAALLARSRPIDGYTAAYASRVVDGDTAPWTSLDIVPKSLESFRLPA